MSESEAVLLQRFTRHNDAEAFAELTGRYAGLVYGACLRVIGDADQAADATQETFFQLLKNAGTVSGSLGAWLHRVATRKAVDVIRRDVSRRRREAAYVQDKSEESDKWQDVSPFVDEAIHELNEELREILVQHFFEGKSMSQIAAERDVSQPTVSRRVDAAVEQLRGKLHKRGIIVAGAALGTLLLNNAAQAAPPMVIQELAKMAIMGSTAAVAGGAASMGTTAGTVAAIGIKAKVVTVVAVAAVGIGIGGVAIRQWGKSGQTTEVAAPSDQAKLAKVDTSPDPGAPSRYVDADTDTSRGQEHEPILPPDTDDSIRPVTTPPTGGGFAAGGMMGGGVAGGGTGGMMGGFGGGMGMGAVAMDFSSPDKAISSFMMILSMGNMGAAADCFVEGADDLGDLQRIMTNPQGPGDLQMKQVFESIGPPIEVIEQVANERGVSARWLSTVNRQFSIAEGGHVMTWMPGDKFELDATLVQVDGQWKIAGI
ncbi:MAG: sigma-70 family RNA polymerase sigma factor [Sedimentisphaerales bacterium]|nr:sigma-70 family RNA polymerase sigma factor [Sedimentisphaerales bacterium]